MGKLVFKGIRSPGFFNQYRYAESIFLPWQCRLRRRPSALNISDYYLHFMKNPPTVKYPMIIFYH